MNRPSSEAAERGARREMPTMRPPRPSEARSVLPPTRRRRILRTVFFALAAVGGFVGGEVVLLALAEPGGLLPSQPSDRALAFLAGGGVALLGGLLCAATYRNVSRRR